MSGDIGQSERAVQNRVVGLLEDELGYRNLGNWGYRDENSNLETKLLRKNLKTRGYDDALITKAVDKLERATRVGSARDLYQANHETYELLRYGIRVSPEPGAPKQTISLIDWERPERNDFAFAEEVSVLGEHSKRPDIVLYVNGIALGVIELKRSTKGVLEGIRQNIGNQDPMFIAPFFATAQILMAGNDTEGVRYGTIETPERHWARWNEPSDKRATQLDIELSQLCEKERFLELIRDFIVFDNGIKKLARPHQYFGAKAAQKRISDDKSGVIWHAQGSGKSMTMVWLAKWLLSDFQKGTRVLLLTDREELDEQIEGVFEGVNEKIYRTKSAADLVSTLNTTDKSLICSLIHKFGAGASGNSIDAFIEAVQNSLPQNFSAKGKFVVFVDECHRTQSGKLHEAMKEILGDDVVLIGFTGTPLLKSDKRRSIETFGPYIHTYKFDEAVQDEVILDLRYEARDVDQELGSQAKVDEWFDSKTKNMTRLGKAELKKRWGTIQKLMSSKERAERIVADIEVDFAKDARLSSGRGNALLVCGDIFQACRYYEYFKNTQLAGHTAIVTSYRPNPSSTANKVTGHGEGEELFKFKTYREMLAKHFDLPEEKAIYKAEEFEDQVKETFVNEPGRMKLLIVVDKLLTGFDAPPATVLYIDKQMQDHGLFQAICRVNRLDPSGDDKTYGRIVDYQDLFRSIEAAYKDYTGGAFDEYDPEDVEGVIKDRIETGHKDLDAALEGIRAICEPVEPPKDQIAYQHYFCAKDTRDVDALNETEPRRIAYYKAAAILVRAYAAIADSMAEAGYSDDEAEAIREEVERYEVIRQDIKLAAGEKLDFKSYDPDMRRLLDLYVRADDAETLTTFNDMTLVDLIEKKGAYDAVDELPSSLRNNEEATAEAIENNTRKLIIDESAVNPKYYERMSALLDALIEDRRKQAISYAEYLEQIESIVKDAKSPDGSTAYPPEITSRTLQALYDNFGQDEDIALGLDAAIRKNLRDNWRSNKLKERKILNSVTAYLDTITAEIDGYEVLELARNQDGY